MKRTRNTQLLFAAIIGLVLILPSCGLNKMNNGLWNDYNKPQNNGGGGIFSGGGGWCQKEQEIKIEENANVFAETNTTETIKSESTNTFSSIASEE